MLVHMLIHLVYYKGETKIARGDEEHVHTCVLQTCASSAELAEFIL